MQPAQSATTAGKSALSAAASCEAEQLAWVGKTKHSLHLDTAAGQAAHAAAHQASDGSWQKHEQASCLYLSRKLDSVQAQLPDGAETASSAMSDVKPGLCQAGSLPQQLHQEAHL